MKPTKSMSFTGTSQRGDLSEALGEAIQQAQNSSHIVDGIVTWTIEKISGENGGFVGKNELSVTIAAKV